MAGTRRRRTTIEAAARDDLAALPAMYRYSALAATYLMLARRLDAGVPTRDMAQLGREMRQCLLALHQLAPAKLPDDPADELGVRRAARMEQEDAVRSAD
jgi:hypothetical protein